MINQKPKLIYIFIIIYSFFSFSSGIKALSIKSERIISNNSFILFNHNSKISSNYKIFIEREDDNNTKTNQNRDNNCNALLGDRNEPNDPAYWIQWSLNLMKYIAIVALLVLSTMDFLKALVNQDKDSLLKATTTTAKRFIFAVIIFFLPIIVEFIMNLFGAYGTCGLG